MKSASAVLILFLITNATIYSQSAFRFEGIVQDAAFDEGIPFATVALYQDSLLVDGMSTTDEGAFSIKTSEFITHIEVSFIGYEPTILKAINILNPRALVVRLTPALSTLDEITVQAQRTTTQLLVDRKVINIGSDLQQSGTTALEAFDQIPEIESDLSTGSIALRGSGNVRILINGKPSSLNATELLNQIPTSSIEKVEIITSPSAKNQASGLSGIINIVLKESLDKGLNLNLNAGVGTKRHSYALNGNYNTSWLNLRFDASHAQRDMDSKEWIDQFYTNGDTRSLYAPHDFSGTVRSYAIGADVSIDSSNQLSFDHSYTNDYHRFMNNTYYTEISNEDDFVYTRNSSHTHLTSILNSNYRRSFKKEGHFVEMDYNRSKNDNILPAEDIREDIFLFDEERRNNNILNDFAIDYTLPVNDRTTFEAGINWNDRQLQSSYNVNTAIGEAESIIFDYSEDIKSAYTQLRINQSRIKWQVGLRIEHFNSNSKNDNNDSTTDLSFTNLFPSVHASYLVDEANTLNVGYSRRISRPNFRHINPFQSRNQYFQWLANPSLAPELSNNIELNYQSTLERLTATASIFYRHHEQTIQSQQTIDEEGVQSIGFDNIGSKNAYGLETMIKFKIANFWNVQLSGNFYHSNINDNPLLIWSRLYSNSIISKHTFKISKTISTDITYRYNGKNQKPFNYIDSRNRIDFAVRVKVLNNRLTANLQIVDVLDNNLMYRTTQTLNVVQKEKWRFQSQTFGILFNLSYKLFQKGNFSRQRKQRNYNHGGSTD